MFAPALFGLPPLPLLAGDARPETPREKARFAAARRAEHDYARRLRAVARQIDSLVRAFPAGDQRVEVALARYAELLGPWAEATAKRMIADVSRRDVQAWRRLGREMARGLRYEIENAPTGSVFLEQMNEQVRLIKSLPIESAEHVHQLTIEGQLRGVRPAEIAQQIMQTGEVAHSRAMLIARTEVSRTATALTSARAQHVGSTMFVWRTVGDWKVRPTHRRLNGKAFRWDSPPECDPGHHALPGAIWNCRCWPDPIIPD